MMGSQRRVEGDDCPDASILIAFAAGRVTPSQRAGLARHIDDCRECAAAVAEAARPTRQSPADESTGVFAHPGPKGTTQKLGRGALLGRYVVLEAIGEGGLGVVYAAYDPGLDRRLAVKVLKSEAFGGADPAVIQVLITREAQALAKVSHPNVVTVFDIGTADGQVFIAMELLEGQTVQRWIARSEPGWSQVRDVFVQAGEGLAAVHDAGLVHRDFKPGNVVVVEGTHARVLDFGLARAAAEVQEEQGVGTPAYMAPEQIAGGEVGPATDQFAFCVAMFEALYGERPFVAHDLQRRLEAIQAGPLFPTRTTAPTWLAEVLKRGLAAQPSDRYPSMSRLLTDLQRDRAKLRRRLSTLALSLGLAGAVGAVTFVQARSEAPAQSSRQQALVQDARAAASRGYFVYPPPQAPEARTALAAVVELEGSGEDTGHAQTLRAEFAATLAEIGDRVWALDDGTLLAVEFYAQALMFDLQHPTARERCMLTDAQLATLVDKAASGTFSAAELLAAEPVAVLATADENVRRQRLTELRSRSPQPAPRVLATVEAAVDRRPARAASPPASRSAPAPPVATAVPAPQAATTAARPPDKREARRLVAAGRTALRTAALSKADQLFHRALEANPKSHAALAGLAAVAFARGDYNATARHARRAVALSPKTAGHHFLLADAYFRLSRYKTALTHYKEAKQLGDTRADARIAKLNAKLGH